MTPIFDGHLDLAWNALSWDRDLTEPLETLRSREAGMRDKPGRGAATVSLPEMRRGGVVACMATLLARANAQSRPSGGHLRTDLDYPTQTAACAAARGQLAYYRLLEAQGQVVIIRDRGGIEKHLTATAQPGTAVPPADQRLGVIVAMEGADPIISPRQLQAWYADGLRVLGLAHYGPSAYAMGTGGSGPLTAAAIELLDEMDRLGAILDLTHSSDPSFWQALDVFRGPVLASHNNCRVLVPGERQFSDDQLRAIIARGGVIGAACDAWMLYPGWQRGKTDRTVVGIDALADHIDHVCQLAGNADHTAIGSDLDGGFGNEQCPTGLDSIADLQKLGAVLRSRGYSERDVENVFYGNWMRFFERHLPG